MPAAASLPDRVGPYRVVSRIATSGTSTLYLGREEGPMGFTRDVALKLVQNPVGGDPEISEELAREAAVCARLNHPGIVHMHRFFEDGPWLVLVLEYVDGASLEELLAKMKERGEKLSDNEIAHIGASVLDALAHGHAMVDEQGVRTPVIHRAVSLSNVLLARDGTVKLGGFGLAKILGRSPDTVIGLIKGAPRYMTPEQAMGNAVTEKVDVYAAGLLLWELFSGTAPIGPSGVGLSAADLALLVDRKHASIATLRADLARELLAVIDTAIEPAPEDRAITCPEMARWVRKFIPVAPGSKQLRERIATHFPPGGRKGTETALRPRAPVLDTTVPDKTVVEKKTVDKMQNEPALRAPQPNRRATLMGLAPYVSPHAGAPATSGAVKINEPSAPAAPVAAPPALPAPSVGAAGPPSAPRSPVRITPAASTTQRFIPVLVTPAAFPPPPPPPAPAQLSPAPPLNVPPPVPLEMQPAFRAAAATQDAPVRTLAGPAVSDSESGAVAQTRAALAATAVAPRHVESAAAPLVAPSMSDSVSDDDDDDQVLHFRVRPKPFLDARQRSIALVAGSVIAIGVAALIAVASHHRAQQSSALTEAAAGTGSTALPPASAPLAAAPPPIEAPSAAAADTSAKETAPVDQLPRGYGYLTVTSSTFGLVWVNMARYGRIGTRLMVPCGTRLISIGRYDRAGHNVWLAPSQNAKIPCGDALELNMEPKRVRGIPAKARVTDAGKT